MMYGLGAGIFFQTWSPAVSPPPHLPPHYLPAIVESKYCQCLAAVLVVYIVFVPTNRTAPADSWEPCITVPLGLPQLHETELVASIIPIIPSISLNSRRLHLSLHLSLSRTST